MAAEQIKSKERPAGKELKLYPGFKRETKVLPKYHVEVPGGLALPIDILHDRDVPVKLRDGTTIYTDIFRPAKMKAQIPAIICGGPYGKLGGPLRAFLDNAPWRFGVPQQVISGLEKFEGLDPAYWCQHGYAIINPDVRGTWQSEGNLTLTSYEDGQDSYDLIEWLAAEPWCNQRVSMAGCSWLGQTQWFAGAARPPHLTCLAPFEGWNDLYNDTAMSGGIPGFSFWENLLDTWTHGINKREDLAAMAAQYPTWSTYWETRKARLDQIEVPLYVCGSYASALHTRGVFNGFIESGSKQKWFRVDNTHEWPDLYHKENVEDLRKFYDYFMKDEVNGWEFTPRVRLSVLNPGHRDVLNRPETEFPLARQQSKRLFLDASTSKLEWETPLQSISTYKLTQSAPRVSFTYTFREKTEITGYMALHLFVSTPNQDDIDVFLRVSKLSPTGEAIESTCIDVTYLQDDPEGELKKSLELKAAGRILPLFFFPGPVGRLRASHRELDTENSTPHRPVYTHAREQKLKHDEIVPLEIEIWPVGMIWEAGEQLKLEISATEVPGPLLPHLPGCTTVNSGDFVIHTGGEYNSHLLVPQIPL